MTGGQPWQRLPLVLVGLALAGAARRRARRAHRRARARLADGLARRRSSSSCRSSSSGSSRARSSPPPAGSATPFPFSHAVRLLRLRAVRRSAVGNGRARGGSGSPAWRPSSARSPGSRPRDGLGSCVGVLFRRERVPRHPPAPPAPDRPRCARSSARRGSTSTASSCRSSSGRRRAPNEALPAMGRWSVDDLRARGRAARRGSASRARDPLRHPGREGRRGLRRLGRRRRRPAGAARAAAALPRAVLLTDVCLCEYTAHGHCGVLRRRRGRQRRDARAARAHGGLATSRPAPTSSARAT